MATYYQYTPGQLNADELAKLHALPDDALLTAQEAAEVLRRGELILLPTETVYGLGADAGDPKAVASVFAAKGRPQFNPLIAMSPAWRRRG